MITLTSSLSGKYFSCSIPDVVFSIAGYRAVVKMTVDGEEIYSEELYPVDGSISLLELSDLLAPYARGSLTVSLVIEITEEFTDVQTTNTASMSADVIYCEADIGTSAEDFIVQHYLSILIGKRITAMGRLEYLHYIGTELATAKAVYNDGSTADYSLTAVGGNAKYTTIDTSSEQFVKPGLTLVAYTVTAGSRVQEYEMDLEAPDCAPILIFVNSFGVEELCYCTGKHVVAPSYKRDAAFIMGIQKNYHITETRTFKADTGVLNTSMANWLDDLFRSQYVRIVNFYQGAPNVGKEVIINESKSEYGNEDGDLPRFTFSYQYAQRNQNVLQLQRSGRIFDNTFDNTFN